ncbi:MAG: hypothetical protein ABIB41_12150 [Nitrospirota bacterium]
MLRRKNENCFIVSSDGETGNYSETKVKDAFILKQKVRGQIFTIDGSLLGIDGSFKPRSLNSPI